MPTPNPLVDSSQPGIARPSLQQAHSVGPEHGWQADSDVNTVCGQEITPIPTTTVGVVVADLAVEDVVHRLESPVRVPRCAG